MFPELITELLQEGYKVNFSAPGHSMFPTIMANETIMVEPIDPGTVRMGDIILYRTNGRLVAHRVIGIEKEINADISATHLNTHSLPQEFIEGDSPLIKRSAPKVKRSSNEVLQNRIASLSAHSSRSPKTRSSTCDTLHFVLQGDASPACDAPVKADQILGKVVSIERNGGNIDPYGFKHKLCCLAISWVTRLKRFLN